MNYRNAFILALSIQLAACSTVGDFIFGRDPVPEEKKEVPVAVAEKIPPSSKFEWAVQSYEAGQYEDAIKEFKFLQSQGTKIPGYDLVPFYLGMSLYQTDKFEEAISFLQSYLKQNANGAKILEARIALLQSFEALKNWTAITTTASEIENKISYAENKAMLKLIWAEALSELKEYNGAKRQFEEAELLLNNIPYLQQDSEVNETGEELHGRAMWTGIYLQANECLGRSIPTTTKNVKGKKIATPAPVDQWMAARGECLLTQTKKAMTSFDALNPKWSKRTVEALNSFYKIYYDTPLALEDKKLAMPKLKQAFYRIVNVVQEKEKSFEYQNLTKRSLNNLIKNLESLILRLSIPSS